MITVTYIFPEISKPITFESPKVPNLVDHLVHDLKSLTVEGRNVTVTVTVEDPA